MSSSSDPNSESYVPIPNGHHPAEPPTEPSRPEPHHKPEQKVVVLIFCGFLLLASLVVFNGYEKEHNDGSPTLVCEDLTPNLIPKLGWKPVSRGVSSGVSEKSSKKLFIDNNWEYPWTHEMLSWQRTSYHFQPEKNWMNDPNGPLFYKGWYHIFYQYNPRSPVWGPGEIVWGHAVSRDLIHWLHLPLALVSDKWYDENGVWTGSATILPNGKVIMLYTGSTKEKVQVQNLAYPANPSDPLLIDWVKYSGNPVLLPPPGIDSLDFRDPTTAWLTSEGKWRLTIGSRINDTGIALVYDTRDFKRFVLKRQILRAVSGTGMWECVDFFPVSANDADNYGLDTSVIGDDVRHVMKVSLDEERHDYYAIGTYDENNVTFVPDDTQNDVGTGLRLDYGIFYASKTFYDHNKNRRVLWSWIGESDDEYVDVAKGWASLIGIPRTVRLDTKTGSNLLQWPVQEVEELRLESNEFKNLKAMPGSMLPLHINGTATQVDIVAEFEIDKEAVEKTNQSDLEYKCERSGGAAERGALGPFGILVLADECFFEYTPIYFYIVKGIDGNLKTSFCSDQSRSSLAYNVDKSIYGSSVPVLKDEKLSIRILVDHSIVESFAQGGRTCVTSRVYPTRAIHGATQLFLFNNATEASVNASVKVWQMDSASISPFHVD